MALALIVLGSLLAPLAIVGWFVRSEIADGESFVEVAAPLARNADIKAAVVDRVTVEVVRQIDAVAPGRVTSEQVRTIANDFVASPQFQTVWDEVLRAVHPQLQQVLLGRDTDLVKSADGKIVLDLDATARLVQQRLVAAGVAIAAQVQIDQSNWSLTLYDSPRLAAVQKATNLLQRDVPWAVALTLLAFVLALAVAPRRLAALRWIGIGLLLGAALVGAGLAVGRARYLDAVKGTLSTSAASAAYDVLLAPLVARVRVWFVVALVLVAIGILAAPSRRRRGDNGSLSHWVAQRRAALVASAVAIALGAVVWWEHPTLPGLLVTAGVVAAVVVSVFVVSGRAMGELEA